MFFNLTCLKLNTIPHYRINVPSRCFSILVNGTAIHLVALVGNVFFFVILSSSLHLNHHTTVWFLTPEHTSHQLFPLGILQESPDWLPFLPVRLPDSKTRSRLSQRCADLLRPRSGSLWVRITAERLTFHDLTSSPLHHLISFHPLPPLTTFWSHWSFT